MKSSSFAKTLRKKQTDAENLLWLQLRNRQLFQTKFRRQYIIPPYIVDFISLERKLIIEVDGGDHNKDKNKVYDKKRTGFLESKGYQVIRFWNNDILTNVNEVLQIITVNLKEPSPQPSP